MVLVDRRGQRCVATTKLPVASVRRVGHGKPLPFWGGFASIGSLPRCGMDFRVFKIKIGQKKKTVLRRFYFIRVPIEARTDKLRLQCYGNCPPKSRERSDAMPRRLF